ncbi:hypothetical protein [Reichenbachiella sp. MALMAid0571]|uniref:hypothetical protein n=1 Tax=Reichenbachiella sp. MALMAid0571 TaxID=3143939 RepID=UPI0032DE9515
MNKFLNYFTTAALILALAIFASCGGGGEEPDAPIDPCVVNAGFLVAETATVKKVTNPNGTIVTDDWTGFTLSFEGSKDGGSYSTNVGTFDDTSLANIWAASGTWTFASTDANCKTLTVNGGFSGGARTVAISAVTASGLNLSFNVPEADTNGRTLGIAGDWFFEFNF